MNLLEKIQAQRAAANTQIRPDGQTIVPGDVSLRGTGITKKEIAKSNSEYNRQTKASLKNDASKGVLLKIAENDFEAGVQATIAEMRAAQASGDIILDESQLRAVAGILHNKVCVLIGAAGTGKTTVTKRIVQKLAEMVTKVSKAETTWVYVDVSPENKVRMREIDAIKQGYLPEKEAAEMPGIAFAAYTGRATQQLRRALPEEWHKNTSTIHSLLGYAPVYEEVEYQDKITGQWGIKERRVFRPSFDASCKLPYQVYVYDEASMIPIPLFNEMIDAIHETSRILLIGDIHQLPPVYGKSVLGYAMRKWPVFELTTIHRQAAGNAIISNAHNVLKGKSLENADNFHLIGNKGANLAPGGMGELQTYVLKVVKKLHEMNRYNPLTDAIIVPGREARNGNMVSSDALNPHFVTMFNPEMKEHGVIVNKRVNIHTGNDQVYFAIRDKVMITANIPGTEPPITNGMIGLVESINFNGKYDMKRSQVDTFDDNYDEPLDLDLGNMEFALSADKEKKEKDEDETEDQRQSSHVMTIKFENGQTYSCSTAGDYRRVQHGYAATCHKSQGGEYPSIIILCHSVNARMLSQEWLYTAITRARNNVYIVCNQRGLDQALGRQVIKGFTLAEKIKSYIIETKSDEEGFDKMKFPILWKPEEV